ncbi:MAG: hypothetical protein K6E87_06540 [bacterium]|nr:hypothetical protein [bacterium]
MCDFLFSLTREDEYYYKYIDTSRCNLVYTYKKNNIFVKVLKKINRFFVSKNKKMKNSKFNNFVCKIAFNKKLIESITNGSKIVILDSYLTEELLLFIKTHDKKGNIYLLIWNKLSEKNFNKFSKYIKKENIYTYSKKDSEKYALKYTNDFHLVSLNKIFVPKKNEIDLYFLGRDKGRFDLISKVANIMDNYKTKIDIFADKEGKKKTFGKINYIKKYISFDEYLSNVIKSKCLLDITSDNNISFRTIESLIFKKKLITNNVDLVNYDFYNENNILIIDEKTDSNIIKNFLSTPYVQISEEVINKYDFYYTYDKFKNLLLSKNE